MQKGVEVEYIVLDGGSSDGSDKIISRYSERLAFWRSHADSGQAAAIAEGFARASGEILGWLNSDDFLLPNALARVVEHFRVSREIEVLNGGGFLVDENGKPAPRVRAWATLGAPVTFDRLVCFGQAGAFQQATFWRRSAYEAVGGVRPELQFIMDLDLFVRLAARRPFSKLSTFLACFRMHSKSKTANLLHVARRERRELLGRLGRSAGMSNRERLRAAWYYAVFRRETVYAGLLARIAAPKLIREFEAAAGISDPEPWRA
jgi:GT2 family glycosyltransferase